MYQMEQKLPKLSGVKSAKKKRIRARNATGLQKATKVYHIKWLTTKHQKSTANGKFAWDKNFDAPSASPRETGNDLEQHQLTECSLHMGSPPRSIMSMLPEAPNLHTIKSKSLKKTKH